MTGRCGSSLVANIFHQHGGWVGTCNDGNQHNPQGFFENRRIKGLIYEYFGKDWLGPIPEANEQFQIEVEREIQGLPILKYGAFYYKVWKDPFFIKIYRNIDKILDSYERCRFLRQYTPKEQRFIIERQIEIMDSIDCPQIHYENLLKRDYTELEHAIESVGFKFDPKIPEKLIDRR